MSLKAIISTLFLTMGSFQFCYLAVEEEQNSSNARGRATGDDEEKSLKQSTLLCCFSPTLFNAAVDADGQNPVDEKMMIVYPKMLGFCFQEQQEEMASFLCIPPEVLNPYAELWPTGYSWLLCLRHRAVSWGKKAVNFSFLRLCCPH